MTSEAVPLKIDEFVEKVKEPLQITVMGICARYNNVPRQIMLPALAIAMGAVMSEASVTSDIGETLRMRKAIEKAFADILKKHASALRTADLSGLKAS